MKNYNCPLKNSSRLATDFNITTKLTVLLFIATVFLFSGCSSVDHIWKKKTTIVKKGVYHTVEEGQTIYRIAMAYDMDPETLLKVNGISDPRKIQKGHKIFIPGASFPRKVASYSSKGKKKSRAGALTKKGGSHRHVNINNGYFTWPVKGKVTSRFGMRKGRPHDGLDIGGKEGSPIRAAADGKVVFSDWGPTGYGRIVIIKHSNDLVSVYAHNKKNLVAKDERVKKGEKIALLGQTGRATGPHLHFEIRADRKPVDPLKHLP